MSKKEKPPPPVKAFRNNPFEALKAIAQQQDDAKKAEDAKVAAAQAEAAARAAKAKAAGTTAPTSHDDDVALFLSRVNDIRPLRGDTRGKIVAPAKVDKRVTLSEMQDLLSQVDRGSAWAYDDTLSVWHGPGVPFALMREMATGKLEPEARLDLHGLRVAIAEPTVEKFLRTAQHERRRCVLIITGRGEDSGGVLRESIGEWLKGPRMTTRVLAFGHAPRSLGGDGATLVLLRRA